MPVEIVFETHGTTVDNETGRATGWIAGKLSAVGRENARDLGRRRREDHLAAVFTSDLGRAIETAEVAFAGTRLPVLHDWRLRECNYGEQNGGAVAEVHGDRAGRLLEPYPGGESWTEATDRVGRFLADLRWGWEGKRVLVIGHLATKWGLDRFVEGADLHELLAGQFDWQEGWEYRLP